MVASLLKTAYVAHVEALKQILPHDHAMEQAIGGNFDTIGPIEVGIVRACGLARDGYLIDVGCGSGRLARPLSDYLTDGHYLGIDLVPDLIAHARSIVPRPDWRFEVVDHIAIPEADGRADLVCFFSVLTHLTHEQSYWYLEEARRVLKPGGAIVFSFLEFAQLAHWPIFEATVQAAKAGNMEPMNVFLERGAVAVWADKLGMELADLRGAGDKFSDAGHLGQAVCVLRKPLAA